MRYSVYILKCSDESYYVGVTNNVKARLSAHQNKKAAAWTANRLPVTLVYHETHDNQLNAIRREKQLKGWSRLKKEKLISGEWEKPDN